MLVSVAAKDLECAAGVAEIEKHVKVDSAAAAEELLDSASRSLLQDPMINLRKGERALDDMIGLVQLEVWDMAEMAVVEQECMLEFQLENVHKTYSMCAVALMHCHKIVVENAIGTVASTGLRMVDGTCADDEVQNVVHMESAFEGNDTTIAVVRMMRPAHCLCKSSRRWLAR